MRTSPKVRQFLRRLAASNDGILNPEDVIEAARSVRSPIHNCFEWDDNEAAHEFRLWQARHLIGTVVKIISVNGKREPVRVFVSLKPDRGAGYRELSNVIAMRETREQLLDDALAELQVFKQKYRQLSELSEVFKAIHATFRKVMD